MTYKPNPEYRKITFSPEFIAFLRSDEWRAKIKEAEEHAQRLYGDTSRYPGYPSDKFRRV